MRRWRSLVAFAVIVSAAVGLYIRFHSRRGGNPEDLFAATVVRDTVTRTVTADGTLQPRTTVQVKSYAGGRVDVLAVEVGDIAKAGDLIAKIDPTDSQATYDQVAADLAAANARLRQAREQADVQPRLTEAAIAQAEASSDVAAMDLARLQEATHPQARAQAKAALDKAAANLDLAEKGLERADQLKAEGFVPQSDVDDARNRHDLAQAELASAREQWATLEPQLAAELEAAKARAAQSQAALDRAQADAVQDRLREADVVSARAQVARAQAAVDNARIVLGYTTITAPRDGVILEKLVEQGTIVTSARSAVAQGTDIVLLGDISQMFVEVSVDEVDVGDVKAGQEATITVDALPDDAFRGRVVRIDPRAVTQQNVTTVLVTVRVDNPDVRLKPGMTAGCEFLIGRAENVLCLPNRALQETGGAHSVLVRQGDRSVPTPVEIGLVGDDLTEIRSGLTEGQEVLLPGFTAPPGMPGSPGDGTSRAQERGRRMGGAGGFIRSGP